MKDLIERLEAATQSDRELDAEIAVASRWKPLGDIKHWVHEWPDGMSTGEWEGWVYLVNSPLGSKWEAPAYTSSLDAARTLVPKGWVVSHAWWDAARAGFTLRREVGEWPSGFAHTPALALCISALKARAT